MVTCAVNYKLIYSMDQYPSWEANSSSVSQEIIRHFMNPGSLLQYSQEPATCPYPEPDQSSPCSTSYILKNHIHIILLFTPRSTDLPLCFSFPHQILAWNSPLPQTCYLPRPSHCFGYTLVALWFRRTCRPYLLVGPTAGLNCGYERQISGLARYRKPISPLWSP